MICVLDLEALPIPSMLVRQLKSWHEGWWPLLLYILKYLSTLGPVFAGRTGGASV